MTEKKKVREVLVRGVVNANGFVNEGNCGFHVGNDLKGEDVEIVKYVEPELIRPEGAEWVPNTMKDFEGAWSLFIVGKVLAIVLPQIPGSHECGYRINIEKQILGLIPDIKDAKRAAEEALADAGLHGFGWESDEDD